jgi:hypothetical protein
MNIPLSIVLLLISKVTAYEVLYAVNFGGEAATDSNGINYQKDVTNSASKQNCPANVTTPGVTKKDEVIYRSVRHSKQSMEIAAIPDVMEDGEYLIIFKFGECWITNNGVRQMNITINKKHTVTIEVHGKDGQGVTGDKAYYFNICEKTLNFKNISFPIADGKLIIDLAPKQAGKTVIISGLVLIKLTGNPVPTAIWPSQKTHKPLVCRTITDVYMNLQHHYKDMSSDMSTMAKDVIVAIGDNSNILKQQIVKFLQNQKSQMDQIKTNQVLLNSKMDTILTETKHEIRKQEAVQRTYHSELLRKLSVHADYQNGDFRQVGVVDIQGVEKNQTKLPAKLKSAA